MKKKFITLKKEELKPAEETVVSRTSNIIEDEDEEFFTFSLDDLDDEEDEQKGEDEKEFEPKDDHPRPKASTQGEPTPPRGGIYNEEAAESDLEILSAKLKKSIQDLEDVRSEMKNTFTSTDTIQSTITSLKGMIDALQKDNEKMRE